MKKQRTKYLHNRSVSTGLVVNSHFKKIENENYARCLVYYSNVTHTKTKKI